MDYYSLEAEQAVLGGLLRDNTVWPSIHEQLTFKDFYRREHQVLFDLISKKLEQGQFVDVLSLSNEVKTIPELKEINGEIYVFELLRQTYSVANILTYVDIVKEHAQKRQFKEILSYLDKHSKESDVKTLVKQAHSELSHLEIVNNKLTIEVLSERFSDIEQQPIDWLWPERIAKGKVTLLAGNPGLGKSQITASLAAIVTTGGIWPIDKTGCQPGNVIFLSAEDDPADTIGPRLKAAGADLTKAHFLKCILTQDKQGKFLQKTFSLKTDLTRLDKFLETIDDVALLIIDPITAYLGDTDSYKNAEVRGLLEPLRELATKHNLAVLAISHLNKASHQDPLMRVSGSLAFVAAARAAYVVAPDPNNDSRRLLLPIKNNIGNDKTGFAYFIEGCKLDNGISTSRVIWEIQPVDIKAHEAMRNSLTDPDEVSVLKEAIDFLKDELTYIPKTVSKLKKAANDYGLSWRTVYRAKNQLEIVVKKEGLRGGWVWSLPKIAKVEPEDCHKNSLATFEDGQAECKEEIVGYLRQNLTNSEKPKEEEVFIIDVSDLLEKKDA